MTPQQTVDLLRLVTQCSPVMKLADGTPAVWHRLLADLPFDEATSAVLAHYATEHRFITPADIRSRVGRAAGLLAPDEDEAWVAASRVASDEGVGRYTLHPATAVAYETCGGAWGIANAPTSVMRAQFRDAYRKAQDRYDRAVLGGSMTEMLLDRLEPREITP